MSRPARKSNGKGIPDRWEDYSKIGNHIKSEEFHTRFLAFKVPLNENLSRRVDESERFTVRNLISYFEENKIKIGLIIDLTFTTRYYNSQDFVSCGIEYEKIPFEGHIVPKKAKMTKFVQVVKSFIERFPDKDTLIGVHCTHGVNRTGYAICRYLIDCESVPAPEAIRLFESCRGHAIDRQSYKQHLLDGILPMNEQRSYHDDEYKPTHWRQPAAVNESNRAHPYSRQNQHSTGRNRKYESRPSHDRRSRNVGYGFPAYGSRPCDPHWRPNYPVDETSHYRLNGLYSHDDFTSDYYHDRNSLSSRRRHNYRDRNMQLHKHYGDRYM